MNIIRYPIKKFLILIFLFICVATSVVSQQRISIKEALVAKTGYNYGREAVFTDQLAYLLYNGNLKQPIEGHSIDLPISDSVVSWKSVKADSMNRLTFPGSRRDYFRNPGSYFYISYNSTRERAALINIQGSTGFFHNGVPHAGDPYSSGWMNVPVLLKKGRNDFFVRGYSITAAIEFPENHVQLLTGDLTLPSVVSGEDNSALWGGVVIVNTSKNDISDLEIKASFDGNMLITKIPTIPGMGMRKVPFRINASGVKVNSETECVLMVMNSKKLIDTAHILLDAPEPGKPYKKTFISSIDSSVQYYAVTPQAGGLKPGSALFFSVHGAGVEAISQARAYKPKDWGTLVAPTNRRPRGFNWEDWGRLDALEVLQIAKEEFKPAEKNIFLTGHSMGGHGTWFLGATYPDKWAAIAPCAGYPTLKSYGSADGLIPDSSSSPVGTVLLNAANQSDVIKMVSNYKPFGIYIFHGDSDRVVSVNYARQMKKVLAEFHTDISYYEYPGGSHWFGDQSVDWKPIFEYFQWHTRKEDSAVDVVDFVTFNPGISSSYRWVEVHQQLEPLKYTRIQLNRDRKENKISGTTQNVHVLKLGLGEFSIGDDLHILLDSSNIVYTVKKSSDSLILARNKKGWSVMSLPQLHAKGPHRNGTLKDAFNHNMVFVYGTTGNREENEWSFNKAKFDAETWYYRGNGAVEIMADKNFNDKLYKDRGVILYGNKMTNSAWSILLNDCPIQVERNKISIGRREFKGEQYGAYFVWPRKNSRITSVAAITGSGIKGMKAAYANQYFAGASGFPDYMIFTMDMLKKGIEEVKVAGFFNNLWNLADE